MTAASAVPSLAVLWAKPAFWRPVAAGLAVLALALLVAALIARPAPDFAALRIVAVLADDAHRPAWAIRLAPAAHQIAADTLRVQSVPAGRAYQLWLSVAGAAPPRPLALLPQQGRKVIPVTPANARLLARAAGELFVTLEPVGGSPGPRPGGPVSFRGSLDGS